MTSDVPAEVAHVFTHRLWKVKQFQFKILETKEMVLRIFYLFRLI